MKVLAVILGLCVVVLGQTKSFIPVDGANLKAGRRLHVDGWHVTGVSRNDNSDAAATYLIHVAERAVAFFRELLSKD
jgi:hypothetical protein